MAPSRFAVGDAVQTSLGKGVVREVRNGARLLVDVQSRSLVLDAASVTALSPPARRRAPATTGHASTQGAHTGRARATRASSEVDLHGLTVDAAMERAERALNEALLNDMAELRLVHGKSGGRIRGALHRRLRAIPSVRSFRLDPRNAGVTIVSL